MIRVRLCYCRKSKSKHGALSFNITLCHCFFSECFYDIANDVLALRDRTDTEEL